MNATKNRSPQPKYQHLSTQNYLQGPSKSCCAFITDIVPLQVECLEGLVQLQEIDRKDRVRGSANWAQNAWKQAQHKRTNHVELEQFFDIFPMSCVVKMVER